MRWWRSLLLAAMFVALALPGSAQTNFAVSDYATFLQALASSTAITNFAANANIVLATGQTIQPPTNVFVDGGSRNVTFSGAGVTRIFHFRPGTSNSLVHLRLTSGAATQGGAIYNEGSLVISNCVLGGNIATNVSGTAGVNGGHNSNGTDGGSAQGAAGGAIWSKGPLAILFSTFTNNSAKGGNGGNGGSGEVQFIFGGNGGNGGAGGGASGGAIFSTGPTNYIFATLFGNNLCLCGAGGLGGSGASANFAGQGGVGGAGASGSGGAIYCTGPLRLEASFFQGNGVNGGATAPSQGSGNDNPLNGRAGGSAGGGAIFLGTKAAGSTITNCTLLANFCVGGIGGTITSGTTGDAGIGGAALGAGVASAAPSAKVVYCTIATNTLVAGSSGPTGLAAGEQIYASPGAVKLVGSIISGGAHGAGINTFGVSDGGFNLSSDSSGVTQATSLANRNPFLSVEVGVVTTNITVISNGILVTNLNYPTTNFDLPVITNFIAFSNTLSYPTNLPIFNLTTNFTIPLQYNYNLITSFTYTNTGVAGQTNTTYTTNYVAGSNGGPTPTLSLSNGSPALEFVNGIPGISYPVTDQRLYYRVSPTALGALDPNGVMGLFVTNAASSNNYSLLVLIYGSTGPPTPYPISDVTSFSIDGTNFSYTIGSETNQGHFYYYGTNITITTNSTYKPGTVVGQFVTNIPVPVISGPPVFGLGQGAMLTASVATNVSGLGFQWQLNGTNLGDNANFGGTSSSNLIVKNVTAHDAGAYTVIAGTTLAYVQTSAVYHVTVTNLPRLAFTAPAAGARTAASPVIVRGTVNLASTVTSVILWMTNLNDGSVTNVSIPISTSKANASWSAEISPSPGTNLLAAWTMDTFGFQSPTVTRKFFFAGAGNLTLRTLGAGSIGGATDKSKLNIGQTYTLTAHPGAKSLFGYWTVITNGGVEIANGTNATLRFLMEADTMVTAAFVTNTFLPGGGVYNGLFYATGTNAGPLGIVSGLTVGSSGAFSGKVFALGSVTNTTVSGRLSPIGNPLSVAVAAGTNKLTLTLRFTGTNIFGTASDAEGESPLLLKKMVHTNVTALYTMLLTPLPTNVVAGDGYVLLTNIGGTAALSGTLADGSTFSQSVGVSSDGDIPLYAALYSDGGAVAGWVPLAGTVESNLIWIKPIARSGLFSGGFTNLLNSAGAQWKVSPAISLPDGGVVSLTTFTNGAASAEVDLNFALAGGNRLVNTNNGTFGAVNPKNGLLTINVTNGSAGGVVTAVGVVMKNLTNGSVSGGGFFLTSTNSGELMLTPNP